PERVRPLGLASKPDRGDAMSLELGVIGLELGDGGGRCSYAGLGEQVLAVPEADHVLVVRNPYCFPLTCQPAAALPSVPIQPDTYWVRSASLPDWIWVASAPPPHC